MLSLSQLLGLDVYYCFFFFQAEDGIRDLVRSRGLGDVYKRQVAFFSRLERAGDRILRDLPENFRERAHTIVQSKALELLAENDLDMFECCLLYTSDAADERSSVDLGGRRIIQKKK